jgi:hypothetical protein
VRTVEAYGVGSGFGKIVCGAGGLYDETLFSGKFLFQFMRVRKLDSIGVKRNVDVP